MQILQKLNQLNQHFKQGGSLNARETIHSGSTYEQRIYTLEWTGDIDAPDYEYNWDIFTMYISDRILEILGEYFNGLDQILKLEKHTREPWETMFITITDTKGENYGNIVKTYSDIEHIITIFTRDL